MAAPVSPDRRDVFANALRSDNLDDALAEIVTALGIADRNTVGAWFSPLDRTTYANLNNAYRRGRFLASWLEAELDAAADRSVRNI